LRASGPCWKRTRGRRGRQSFLRQLARVVLLVELRAHAVLGPVLLEHADKLLRDEPIFHPVGDRGTALGNVHRCVISVLLAWRVRRGASCPAGPPGGRRTSARTRPATAGLPATRRSAGGSSAHRRAPPKPFQPARSLPA